MRAMFLSLVLGIASLGLVSVTPSAAVARDGPGIYGSDTVPVRYWRGGSHWRGGTHWRGNYYYPRYYSGYYGGYYYPRYSYYYTPGFNYNYYNAPPAYYYSPGYYSPGVSYYWGY